MNIIVTGASRGIGYEMVRLFAGNGNHRIFAISRNEEKLQKLVRECEKINHQARVIPVVLDLLEVPDSSDRLEDLKASVDQFDILINNAGSLIKKSFQNTNLTEVMEMFHTNFFAPAFLIRELLSHMGKKGKTHIVNISSMGGFQGSSKYPGLAYYSASKASLAVLTECLPAELKNSNICVNCLALGAAQTEMFNEAFPGHKAPVSAAEMAVFIVDFAMNGHQYFNGKIIPVGLSNP
ncbi:MAG TPA: SDR family oxidoreductase [Bacteroidales bacterium]|nr:SDR family oxidoreductase [Bacteroidales bacterium]